MFKRFLKFIVVFRVVSINSFVYAQDDNIPPEFIFNQSQIQGGYLFLAADIAGVALAEDDWVGAFNGDICVGARKWDTSECLNGICDIPLMGDDYGYTSSFGYLETGNIPTFKIYDSSTNTYYDAKASTEVPWTTSGVEVIENLQGGIFGCNDPLACNLNPNANLNDGSCIYPENNYNCDGIPTQFEFNQSTLQAFYYVDQINDIDNEPLSSNDWVAVFNGDVCVGSRKWDTSMCNGGICDIPAMGDDSDPYNEYPTEYSDGYLQTGDYPTFKIYDHDKAEYFDVYPSENFAFESGSLFNINELTLDYHFTLFLEQDLSLISFYSLPEDQTTSSVLEDILPNLKSIIGEATSAQYSNGLMTGSLVELDHESGYWIELSEDDTLNVIAQSYNPERLYNLNTGPNLISFPAAGTVEISEGLPDDIEDNIIAVIGVSEAKINTGDNWIGTLSSFEGGHGYWIITTTNTNFQYDLNSLTTLSRSKKYSNKEIYPAGFEYYQSTQQAFYFIENIELIDDEIENGDWLLSYCGNVVTGARKWTGETTDVPVMGTQGNLNTAGYCDLNDVPSFKLLKTKTQKLTSLNSDIPVWEQNGIFVINSLKEANQLPNKFTMQPAYPNPFNPSTNIVFDMPNKGILSIKILNIKGQEIATLTNGTINKGSHEIKWNARDASSGVYFIKFNVSINGGQATSHMQKLILIK